MSAYIVVDTQLTDPELYEQYKLRAKPLAEQFGGTYLARGGPMVVKESDLWSPTRMVLIEFPSVQQARDFYESPQYRELLGIGRKAARRTLVILEGL